MTIIGLSLILVSLDTVAPIPKLKATPDLKLETEITTGLHRYRVYYVSKSTKSVLGLDYYGDGSRYGNIHLDMPAALVKFETKMPDGYPLGEEARILNVPGTYMMQAIVGGVQIRLDVQGVRKTVNGRATFENITTFDGPFCIAAMRQFSARVAGKRGKAGASFTASGTGVKYEKLTSFTGLDGKWPNASRVRAKVNGKDLIFVLGANGVKKNGVWQSLGDSPMVIGSDLYVPKAALQ